MARAARLGLHDTFEAMADRAVTRALALKHVSSMANNGPGGNLASQAAQSRSFETLEKVTVLSAEGEVPFAAADVDLASSTSALLWAAVVQSRPMIALLMESDQGAPAACRSLPGELRGLTPFKMFSPVAAASPDTCLEAAAEPPILSNTRIRSEPPVPRRPTEPPSAGTPIDPMALSALVLPATAAIITSAPRQWASQSAYAQGRWCQDPPFLASRMSLVSTWCFGACFLFLPSITAVNFSPLNHGFQSISAGSLAQVAIFVSVAVFVQQALMQRVAKRTLE